MSRLSSMASPATPFFDLEAEPFNSRHGEQKMRPHRVVFLLTMICAAIPDSAQSLCELVPAAIVQSTLGIPVTLAAAPTTQGGNGCDYKGASTGPITITVTADAISDAGMHKRPFLTSACIASAPPRSSSPASAMPPTTISNRAGRSLNTPALTSPSNPSSSAPRARSSTSSL